MGGCQARAGPLKEARVEPRSLGSGIGASCQVPDIVVFGVSRLDLLCRESWHTVTQYTSASPQPAR